MRSYQGNIMKKVILTAVLLLGTSLVAEVHYDIRETEKPQTSKPNHPSTSLYGKK